MALAVAVIEVNGLKPDNARVAEIAAAAAAAAQPADAPPAT
jgi:hypothetical protein